MYKKRLKKLKETEAEGKMLKNKNGITLIALVVTIVVLLILAGVTLTLVLDNNGIIKKSKDAKEQYGQARENEQADLSNLSDWIDDAVGVVNWDKILDDAEQNPDKYKHPEQSDTNGDIGIGTDGKPVNMDLWTYEIINTNEIRLGIRTSVNMGYSGYNNSKITESGEIQGKVPQYIKKDGESSFYPVTDMCVTFMNCTNLKIAPEFPSTVTNLSVWDENEGSGNIGTFFNCTGLEVAPKIPEKVKDLTNCFSNCTSLTTAPEIPSSVTNMKGTFSGCTSLTTAPEIPSSVTNMGGTFWGCTSLTAAPEIPSSVTNMWNTFGGCTSLTTAPEIPSSVTNIGGTFWGCTSLTAAPEIPSSVTNMWSTFEGCTSLTTAPEIPSSVTRMRWTFKDCTSLTTAPEIPSSVTDMGSTFSGCTSLTGNLVINANPKYYSNCLNNASTAAGTNLVVSGTSTLLDEIIATKSANSNITKGN